MLKILKVHSFHCFMLIFINILSNLYGTALYPPPINEGIARCRVPPPLNKSVEEHAKCG